MTGYPRQYGKYVLLEPIGAGGMSEVDLAHRGMGEASFVRFVAIKRVARSNLTDEGYIRMFMDEARINAELHHGNIVQVFDFGKLDEPVMGREEYFMVMEYVPGLDLRALQRAAQAQGTLLPLRFSLAVLSEVLCGLQYAHTKVDTIGRPMNLVHRDINPRNVMVSVSGEVKVIDFGVALAEDRLEKTQGRSLKGKFAYMSPEQIEGNLSLDGRTDLYAVGLMLHELVEGKGAFHGLTELQIMHRIVMGQVPELQAVSSFPRPDLLRRVHARALARDRDRRYPDATTFKRDIDALADLLGGPATQDERAALVHGLAPTQVDGIGDRLRQYHEHSHSVSRSVAVGGSLPLPDSSGSDLSLQPTADATASLGGETQELPKDLIEPPPAGLRRVGVLLLALVGLGLLFALGAGVGLALWLHGGRSDQRGAYEVTLPTEVAVPAERSAPPPVAVAPEESPPEVPPVRPTTPQAGTRAHSASSVSAVQPTTPSAVSLPVPEEALPAHSAAPSQAEGPAVGAAAPPVELPPAVVEPVSQPVEVSAAPPGEAPTEAGSGQPTTAGPMGTLMVTSSDPAQVVVDGKIIGTTPLKVPFPQGTYTVVVMGAAGELCRQQATVSSRPQPVLCRAGDHTGGQRDDDEHHQR